MKYILIFLLVSTSYFSSIAQIEGKEIGFDVTATASNFNGNAGLGLKFGFKFSDYFIAGPSARYQRTWFNNQVTGQKGGYNIYGGGAFIHARFAEYFFAGSEFELLRSPINFSGIQPHRKWVPVLLLGGGFSTILGEKLRFNAGIMYDILDIQNQNNLSNPNPNSPLQPYIKVSNKKIVPLLYRISFFVPIGE